MKTLGGINVGERKHPILTVDFRTEYDTLSEGVVNWGRACVDLGSIQSGLLKQIGVNRFGVLLGILSYMDKDGKSYPSQRKLAELTGQSVNTVNKLINELLLIEFNGQHVLKRTLTGEGPRKRSMYYITSGEVSTTEGIEMPKKQAARMNSRDAIIYFSEIYESTFGAGYSINWGKDSTLIKSKLLPLFKDDATLISVIDISILRYKKMWANKNYPLPTISMLCTWIANASYGIYQQEQAQSAKQAKRIEQAAQQDDTDKALDLL